MSNLPPKRTPVNRRMMIRDSATNVEMPVAIMSGIHPMLLKLVVGDRSFFVSRSDLLRLAEFFDVREDAEEKFI